MSARRLLDQVLMRRFELRAGLVVGLAAAALSGTFSGRPMETRSHSYPIAADPSEPLEPKAAALNMSWPPARLRLIALKQEKVLEVWIANRTGPFRRLTCYAILAASGTAGPKRMEGDLQVPEGIYRLTTLNPQSRFHLSVRVDYPNAIDLMNSRLPKDQMGGDIYVHGNSVSIGCLAIGDEAIERLYDLLTVVNARERWIEIVPVDFRLLPDFHIYGEEPWVDSLYEGLKEELKRYPISGNPPIVEP